MISLAIATHQPLSEVMAADDKTLATMIDLIEEWSADG